jgi:hypothetical protein
MPEVQFREIVPDILRVEDDSTPRGVAHTVFTRLYAGRLAVLVRTSRLRGSLAERRRFACAVVDEFAGLAAHRFGLERVATEVDRPQRCDLPAGTRRTLLPHHDGGHCSYLTTPAIDRAPMRRSFSNAAFCTTDRHKIYHGLFLHEAGDGLSLTSYFNLVEILDAAYARRHGRPAALDELMRYYDANVSAAIERSSGVGYLPIGAQIGATGAARDVAIHSLEARYELGRESFDGVELAESLAATALGLTFAAFMRRHAVLAPAQTSDLLIGHNLFAWHGGVEGGDGREIVPVCVIAHPGGPAYERWLQHHWEQFHLARARTASEADPDAGTAACNTTPAA